MRIESEEKGDCSAHVLPHMVAGVLDKLDENLREIFGVLFIQIKEFSRAFGQGNTCKPAQLSAFPQSNERFEQFSAALDDPLAVVGAINDLFESIESVHPRSSCGQSNGRGGGAVETYDACR